jgi:hypothetical protein
MNKINKQLESIEKRLMSIQEILTVIVNDMNKINNNLYFIHKHNINNINKFKFEIVKDFQEIVSEMNDS